MGGGAADRPPYWRVWHLTGWTRHNADLVRGALYLRGIDPDELPVVPLLDVAWWLLIDGLTSGFAVRDNVVEAVTDVWDQPPVPTEETWGTSRSDQERSAAMYELAGGPAPARPRKKRTPAAAGAPTPTAGSERG